MPNFSQPSFDHEATGERYPRPMASCPADRCLNDSEAHQGGGPGQPDRSSGFTFLFQGRSKDSHEGHDLSAERLERGLQPGGPMR